MKRYYCTYFDRNYLIKGLALIESLNKHERNDFELFIVCLDEITRLMIEKLKPPHVTLIPLHEVEQKDKKLLQAKQNRSLVEYYWTLTPTVLLWLLDRNPNIDMLTYLDADLYFYAPPDPIYEEFENASVLIHEHRFSPSLKHLEKFGKYNVGLLCFRNDSFGLAALRWWRKRCIEWCYTKLENGKFGDQLYLNDWPERFENVHILQNIGAGVAPWNHDQYEYRSDTESSVLINDHPLIFYHFHGLAFVTPHLIIPAVHYHPLTEEIIRYLFLPYIHALTRGISEVQSVLSDFTFGIIEENQLTTAHTFLVRNFLTPDIKSGKIPQSPVPFDRDWDCFCSPQITCDSKIIGKNASLQEKEYPKDIKVIQIFNTQKEPIDSPKPNPKSLNESGETLYESGDTQSALNAFKEAIQLDPNLVSAHNNLGVLYWEAGETKQAIQHFTQAIDIDPYDRNTVLNCGEILQNLKRHKEAKAVYTAYLRRYPEDRDITKAMGNL